MPDSLLSPGNDGALQTQTDALWTAAHAKPRCEKILKDYCRRFDIPVYLPLRKRTKRYQRRNVTTYVPMFPGYLFVQLDSENRTTLLNSHKVVYILPIDELAEEQLVRELNELKELERRSEEREILVQPEIVPGKLIRVSDGPMKGLEGVVTRRRDQLRVTVNVELLGQSASVDIDIGDVEIEGA